MKRFVLAALLIVSSAAFPADTPARCSIAKKSILSRDSGIPQVSNLGEIEVTCSAPGRPWPRIDKLPTNRSPLKVSTVAYQVSSDGTKTLVPSLAHSLGGGSRNCMPTATGGPCDEESTFWDLNIPIDPAEAIAELRQVNKKLEQRLPRSEEDRQKAEAFIRQLETDPEELAETVGQHRPGHFQIECRMMDGDRVWAVGHLELEIIFKGNAFDDILQQK